MSQAIRPIRSSRIPQRDLEALILRLQETGSGTAAGVQRRGSQRLPFHARNVPVEVTQSRGESQQFLVDTYSLSTGGVAFVHGGYLHNGTRLVFQLPTRDNAWQTLAARVVRCRHVERGLHDVGAAWVDRDEPLELTLFVDVLAR